MKDAYCARYKNRNTAISNGAQSGEQFPPPAKNLVQRGEISPSVEMTTNAILVL